MFYISAIVLHLKASVCYYLYFKGKEYCRTFIVFQAFLKTCENQDLIICCIRLKALFSNQIISKNWVLQMLTLSVPTIFCCFHYLQKIGCNQADFCDRNTICIPNERYQPQLFSAWLRFWNCFNKVKKSAFENFIFWGVCEKAHTPGT